MSARTKGPEFPPGWTWQPGLVPVAAALIVLGAEGRLGLVVGGLVAVVGVAIAWSTNHPRFREFRALGPAAILAAGIALAAAAPFSLETGLVAGVVGLSFLLWIASAGPRARPLSDVAPGLLWPALALLVAVGASAALPVGQQAAGVAGVLLVAALVAVAYLLVSAGSSASGTPSSS